MPRDTTEKQIHDLYYDPRRGFSSKEKLKQKINPTLKKSVKKFVDNQAVQQVFKTGKKRMTFPITAQPNSYQIDLIFYPRLKQANNGISIAMTIIEITNRRAYCYPVPNKTAGACSDVFKNKFMPSVPKIVGITSDDGKEFKGAFAKLLKQHGIQHYIGFEGEHTKLGMIESFNRTIKRKLGMYMESYKTKRWFHVLDDLVFNYNHTIHSSIGKEPAKMTARDEQHIRRLANNKINYVKKNDRVAIGDTVRIKLKKKTFQKQGANYSRALYTVTGMKGLGYTLQDTKGKQMKRTYKFYELMVVKNPKQIANIRGLDVANIVSGKRVRKRKKRIDL